MGSLIYFLIAGAAIFFMMRFGCGAHVMGHGHGDAHFEGHQGSEHGGPLSMRAVKVVDPVCNMSVETATAKSVVHDGEAYYFCSQDCRAKFEDSPLKYLKPANVLLAT